jgi:hypothetical protein
MNPCPRQARLEEKPWGRPSHLVRKPNGDHRMTGKPEKRKTCTWQSGEARAIR